MSAINETTMPDVDDSDDEIDWEEVAVPVVSELPHEVPRTGNIEITLKARTDHAKEAARQKSREIHAARLLRIECHQLHTVSLLVNGWIRNKWINDDLLHARLLSVVPLPIQNSFAAIHKSNIPEIAMRGRMFEAATNRLVDWWANEYFQVEGIGIRSRTFEEVQRLLSSSSRIEDALKEIDTDDVIRSPKSLQKHALMQSGSRDTSAQLFTATCRAMGIPARLVVSFQSVPWQAGVGKPKLKATPKLKGKGKGKEKATEEDEDMDMEEVDIPVAESSTMVEEELASGGHVDGATPVVGKGKQKQKAQPVIRLRKSKGRQKAKEQPSAWSASTSVKMSPDPDALTTPPVFWTEVFSRPDACWIPVDPIRALVNKKRSFDPGKSPGNRMVYVVAFEEDGFARDVTPRYALQFGAKVSQIQGAEVSGGTKGRKAWWDRVLEMVKRPYVLRRDEAEDEEIREVQVREGMPTSMAGFKGHPLYVLERHLKQNETIHPVQELGKFRGEPVYPRSSVVSLKSAENWMREGRKVREGMQAMKQVKVNASTIRRKRELEMMDEEWRDKGKGKAKDVERDGDAEGFEIDIGEEMATVIEESGVMQRLYAVFQTEVYKPPPIVNGKIPKNDFGNIDLYVESMLPEGAVHIPYKGTAKIARMLGFDYAEAVTGFEFRKRRATPILTGIVIAAENEPALLEAYWEVERDAEQKRRIKRHEQVLKRWTRLIGGLRIRQRLQRQYANGDGDIAEASTSKGKEVDRSEGAPNEDGDKNAFFEPGGYLTAVDDIVQPFTLPRYQHVALEPSTSTSLPSMLNGGAGTSSLKAEPVQGVTSFTMETIGDVDDDEDMEEVASVSKPTATRGVPKTMRELAEDAARITTPGLDEHMDYDGNYEYQPASSAPSLNGKRAIRTPGVGSSKNTPASAAKRKNTPKNGQRQTKTRKRSREDTPGSESDAQPNDEDSNARPSPAKRARERKVAAVTGPVARSERVLRTRKSKTATELREERDRELAFRSAVAE